MIKSHLHFRDFRHLRCTTPQSGITLIEVLIAVLILAGGMLGTAALQGRSLIYNNQAYLNTQATMVAYDMLDRIRANSVYGLDGPGYSVSLGNLPATYPTTCEIATCTPVELARTILINGSF